MGKKVLYKDIYMEFTKSISRFISIMVMIALGSFIFVGLNVTGPTMRNTITSYADKYDLPDLTISSPLGLEIEDEVILSSISGVKMNDYSYRTDVITLDSNFVIRVEAESKMPDYEILEGRLPKNDGEISLDGIMLGQGYETGDAISFLRQKFQGEYALNTYDYTIVGFINSPEYLIPAQKGSSSIGDGEVDCFGVVCSESFNLKNYSFARLTFDDVDGLNAYSDEYKEKMKVHINGLETAFASRPEIRLKKYREEGLAELDTAEGKISDSEKELLKAKTDLYDARQKLDDAWSDYKDGKATFENSIADAQAEITKGREELWDAKDKLKSGYEEFEAGEKKFEEARDEYNKALISLKEAEQELKDGEKELKNAQSEIDAGTDTLAEKEAALYTGLEKIDAGLIQIKNGLAEIDTGLKLIEENLLQIEMGLLNADYGISAGQNRISEIEANLVDINSALTSIENTLSPLIISLASVEASVGAIDGQIEYLNNTLNLLEAQKSELEDRIIVDPIPELFAELDYLIIRIAETSEQLSLLEQEKSSFDEQKSELENQIAPLQAELSDLQALKNSLEIEKESLFTEINTLQNQKSSLLAQRSELQTKKESAILQKPQLETQYESLTAQKQNLLNSIPVIEKAYNDLQKSQEELDKGFLDYYANKVKYEDGLAELEEGKVELERGEAELTEAETKLLEGQLDYDKGQVELEDAILVLSKEKIKGDNELSEAYRKILEGERDYEKGYKDYISKLPDAVKGIAQGKEDILEAKNQLALLKVPDYTIQDRYKDMGFYQYIENSESMDLLSSIFPVFFFLIALLVSLTTMTRMTDEQRTLIGTLKAIGYSNIDIIKKYLIYGSVASMTGSIAGIIGGQKILMPVVFNAYSSNFLFEEPLPVFSPAINAFAIIISLFCTGIVALITTRSSLRDNVSILLRPKTPKTGNRIFLERLNVIWSRLSFNYKVTFRNIFRYKKRILMTILGVAGCTALIFMGFAIKDSVGGIMTKQYSELFKYDTIVIYNDNASDQDIKSYYQKTKNDDRVEKIVPVRYNQGIIQIPGKLDQTINIIVPMEATDFSEINTLRERKSKKSLSLEDGAIISEKIADILELEVGQYLTFKDTNDTLKEIYISGITENYTGHYMYMPIDYYEIIFNKEFKTNGDFIILYDHDIKSISSFSKNILEQDIVLRTINTSSISKTISELVASLNIVVLVIILASSLLAIVVLYNLTNINVSERIRELSTIMVLGFYPGELTAYVYRETMILTILGIFSGFFIGQRNYMHLLYPRYLHQMS